MEYCFKTYNENRGIKEIVKLQEDLSLGRTEFNTNEKRAKKIVIF